MRIIKRNKKELLIEEPVINGEFSKEIKTHDIVIFTCSKCKKEASREASKFITPLSDASFFCKSCISSINMKNRQEKLKQVFLKKYGVLSVGAIPNIQEKIKKTNLKKYGCEVSSKNSAVKAKAVNTKKEKNSTRNNLNSYKEKTGYSSPFENPIVRKKIEDVNIKKFGTKTFLVKDYFYKKLFSSLIERNKELLKPLFCLEEYKGNNTANKYKWECLKCGNIFEDHIDNGRILRCLTCFPYNAGISIKEKEVLEFCKTLNLNIVENDNSFGKELDIYFPDKNFGIEFDGIYWHSDEYKEQNFHVNKTNFFKEKNIDIIHIFEDEWDNKKEIVKSIIKSRLNIYDEVVYARKCEIKTITNEEEYSFLQENHIQGYVGSSIKIGLFYNGNLVSLMSIGISRFNDNYKYELLRFANKLNTKVIGGASKLFKYLNTKSIISYCDIRYFTGFLYEKLGFSYKNKTTPNYYYVLKNNRYSRLNFQKHKLKDLLENFNNELTEKENMKNNGYNIIYDCGVKVFTLE